MFGKSGGWKMEYDDTLYKIYDWDGNLAGYFFPQYGDIEPEDKEEEIIDELNKTHSDVQQATLLLPMVKLSLLDKHEGMDIDYVISSLEANTERTGTWKKWLHDNAKSFRIVGAAVHTAREDRNMLSIALGIVTTIKLGEREVRDFLAPLLNRLHEDGLL
ncbi:MAG TPA: hypothetical protein VGQ13_04800 [Nitrososphaera sp.]|nr:hypothetical protein [Nitrososphaera sp.]